MSEPSCKAGMKTNHAQKRSDTQDCSEDENVAEKVASYEIGFFGGKAGIEVDFIRALRATPTWLFHLSFAPTPEK
jgi:hypothetical protein